MNKQTQTRLILIVFLILGCTVGLTLAAVPQSTVRTTGGGVTTYVGHYMNATLGYFMGTTQIIDNTNAAFFSDVTDLGLTPGRVTYAGLGGILTDDADLTFVGDTLSATNVDATGYYLSSVNKTDILKYPFETASYTITTDGSNYYGKNGSTGVIQFIDTDAAVVIRNAVTALPNGGLIKIGLGTFTLSSDTPSVPPSPAAIVVTDNIHIEGSGWSTILRLDDNVDAAVIGTTPTHATNVKISNLKIDGNKANQNASLFLDGISLSVDNFIVEDVYIQNALRYGINPVNKKYGLISGCYITGCSQDGIEVGAEYTKVIGNTLITNSHNGLEFENVFYGMAQNNIMKGNAWNGIQIDGASYITMDGNLITGNSLHGILFSKWNGTETPTQNIISDNEIFSNTRNGIKFETGIGTTTIDGNQIFSNDIGNLATYSGINITDSLHVTISDNMIRNNDHSEIYIGTGNYIIITGNDVDGADHEYAMNVSSSDTLIHNNWGYVTENSGTATLLNANTNVTVTHGLSYTPTAKDITITFTELPTNPLTGWYVGNITSTVFVFFGNDPGASNLDFSWHAIRTP